MTMAMRVSRRRVLTATSGAVILAASGGARAGGAPWRKLWNGRDLQGFTTWVGIPHKSRVGLTLKQNPDGTYAEPLGENLDPRGVYSVATVHGQRVLRISGELFGALTTVDSFANYHLYVKWRWGQAQWEPRATGPRDSGILIHATGAHGASGPSRNWMRSIECQIQEGDCGDLWSVGGVKVKVPARAAGGGQTSGLRFAAGAPVVDVPVGDPAHEPRVHRGFNKEHPRGQWNVTEVLVNGDRGTFKVNGHAVMAFEQAQVEDGGVWRPLTQGRIQIQSEGAEIFLADIKLRPLPRSP